MVKFFRDKSCFLTWEIPCFTLIAEEGKFRTFKLCLTRLVQSSKVGKPNSVLTSLNLYNFSCFKDSVCTALNRTICNLWWGHDSEKKKAPLTELE